MARYTVRPISDRIWLRPDGARDYSPFSATWSDTIDLLIHEVYALQRSGMPDPVIEVDVGERDIRVDGELRADAKAATPAVVVAFESIHGPLLYRCDRYVRGSRGGRMDHWQHNVRAIGLTLQALRAVDRYGATRRAEQYQGFRALPAGSGVAPTGMTTDTAMAIIANEAGQPDWLTNDEMTLTAMLRLAKANTHPDRNDGDRSRWDAVEHAEQVLRRAGRL